MATLGPPASRSSPSTPFRRRSKSWARKCERYCCACLTFFPLAFVYGLTSWAVWAQWMCSFSPIEHSWTGAFSAVLGLIFYLLLNWSYTVAVFTDPGSPLSTPANSTAYTAIPTVEHDAPEALQERGDALPSQLTVKFSTGGSRYCKKCATPKPDRAHHCSTCRRCVLKMDHHCPWLATCVGFRNYKPFVLFLIYVCIFCTHCFAVTASWVWGEIIGDNVGFQAREGAMPVNYILLCVLAGILAIVLTGFTGWHVWLCTQGKTTIESLESTRYLSDIKKTMANQLSAQHHNAYPPRHDNANTQAPHPIPGRLAPNPRQTSTNLTDHLREIHANALPGITRPEEGVSSPSRPSSPSAAGPPSETDRYTSYLSQKLSTSLPHAFDHGWRTNLRSVFGPTPALWALPICNSLGDGWHWAPSAKWRAAREAQAHEQEARDAQERGWREAEERERQWLRAQREGGPMRGWGREAPAGTGAAPLDGVGGVGAGGVERERYGRQDAESPSSWNDIPADLIPLRGRGTPNRGTRSPRPGGGARAYPEQ